MLPGPRADGDGLVFVSYSHDDLATGDSTGLVIVWDRDGPELASIVLQPSRCLVWGAPFLAVGQPVRPALLTLRDPADLED